jgi:predicted phage terminase large subunit-like protein
VVLQVWGRAGARFFLVHQVRERLGYAATKAAIRNLKRLYPDIGGIFIEDAANGTAVIEELGHEIPGIIPVRPLGGKVARANAAQPFLEAGNCFLPDPDAPGHEWVAEFIEECAAFPRGAHDDQVDAWSQAMAQLGHFEAFEPEGLSY